MSNYRLPHDAYMTAVAEELERYGLPAARWDATTADGELLEGYFHGWPASEVSSAHWPHGVTLIWDQHAGWRLVEDGGGRNIVDLDAETVGTFCRPQQVAASTANRVRGHAGGDPICTSEPWDSRPLEAAIAAWEQQAE